MMATLSKPYVSRYGAPRIGRVDATIFTLAYFADCRTCAFCADACCLWGVDVDAENMVRLLRHAAPLEARTGVPRALWFEPGLEEDVDFPGGRCGRTRVADGTCVFLDRKRRGCHIHGYCLDAGIEVYHLKPLVSSLFPLTFGEGALLPADEVEQSSLVCAGEGRSVYRGARDPLAYLFGADLVTELDRLEEQARCAGLAPPA